MAIDFDVANADVRHRLATLAEPRSRLDIIVFTGGMRLKTHMPERLKFVNDIVALFDTWPPLRLSVADVVP